MPQPEAIVHWGSVDSLPQSWNGAIAYLDRDGVINKGLPNYVKSLDELEIFDEALESIERLVYEGYIVCVVTNQSQVSRGYMSKSDLDVIHSKLLEISKIRLILTCIHHPNQGCNCRKPSPGMLRLADGLIRGSNQLSEYVVQSHVVDDSFSRVNWWSDRKPKPQHALDVMVGDRRSDLGAGWAVGARLFQTNNRSGLIDVIEDIITGKDGVQFNPV